MGDILSSVTRKDIYCKLKNLSHLMGDAFNKTFERIDGQNGSSKRLAWDALTWVLYAKRPLKTTELVHALAIDLEDDDFDFDRTPLLRTVLQVCCGLLVVNQNNQTVRLVHYALKEHLVTSRNDQMLDDEGLITKKLLKYLCFEGTAYPTELFLVGETPSVIMVLSGYAAEMWYYHAKHSRTDFILDAAMSFIKVRSRTDFILLTPFSHGEITRLEEKKIQDSIICIEEYGLSDLALKLREWC